MVIKWDKYSWLILISRDFSHQSENDTCSWQACVCMRVSLIHQSKTIMRLPWISFFFWIWPGVFICVWLLSNL